MSGTSRTRALGSPSSLPDLALNKDEEAATTRPSVLVLIRARRSRSAGLPPCFVESSDAALLREEVKTPTLNSMEAWQEMRRRFRVAHDPAATRDLAPARFPLALRNRCCGN
ncbi:hypothetical protein T484DRAFT_2025345 [Baffinella frigidus]|nr:hypothetical protein T484DRAFT_2025345 [Cryptophyta sp. CCMP2293]